MITGKVLRDAFVSGANSIIANRQAVDRLNVFPVPDGDTGTNMSMTIESAVKELKSSSAETVGEVSAVVASALLRGARGNSGVILSLLFRGFSKGLKGKEEASAEDLAEALKNKVIAAAALDVFCKEPPEMDNPLLSLPNVLLLPHCGAGTTECFEKAGFVAAKNVADFFAGKTVPTILNKDYINNVK